jgi:hypothetical protein
MFGTPMVLLTIATLVLAAFVWTLFEQDKEIRSGFEARLKAVEGLEGPFARKLADTGPAALLSVLSLDIRLETQFWTQTLQLTPVELDEIRPQVSSWPWYEDLSKKTNWSCCVRIRIQKWRGGYTQIRVENPFNKDSPEAVTDLFDGLARADLWRFFLPRRAGESSPELRLELDSGGVKLSARWASRFSLTDSFDAEGVVFLSVPLLEGPAAEQYYCDHEVANTYPSMWKRRYEHLDLQKGLAWSLSVHDYDLLARSEGDCRESRDLLLAEWRARFAYNDAGKEWFRRVSKMFEDWDARKKTELAERSSAREQSWKCQCGAVVDRTEFKEACPHCGKRFS